MINVAMFDFKPYDRESLKNTTVRGHFDSLFDTRLAEDTVGACRKLRRRHCVC